MPEPYNNVAVLYASQGQFEKARDALEMATRNSRSYATAHENLGDVYARLAEQSYRQAVQLDAGNTTLAPKLTLIRQLINSPAASRLAPFPGPTRPPAKAARRPNRHLCGRHGRRAVTTPFEKDSSVNPFGYRARRRALHPGDLHGPQPDARWHRQPTAPRVQVRHHARAISSSRSIPTRRPRRSRTFCSTSRTSITTARSFTA